MYPSLAHLKQSHMQPLSMCTSLSPDLAAHQVCFFRCAYLDAGPYHLESSHFFARRRAAGAHELPMVGAGGVSREGNPPEAGCLARDYASVRHRAVEGAIDRMEDRGGWRGKGAATCIPTDISKHRVFVSFL